MCLRVSVIVQGLNGVSVAVLIALIVDRHSFLIVHRSQGLELDTDFAVSRQTLLKWLLRKV